MFESCAHGLVLADPARKLLGDAPRDFPPVGNQVVFFEAEALGPNNLVIGGIDELDEQRRRCATRCQPRVEHVGDRMAQDHARPVGMACDLCGGMGCDDRDAIQGAKADGHVLDQRL